MAEGKKDMLKEPVTEEVWMCWRGCSGLWHQDSLSGIYLNLATLDLIRQGAPVYLPSISYVHHHHHLSLDCEGHWGTTDDSLCCNLVYGLFLVIMAYVICFSSL